GFSLLPTLPDAEVLVVDETGKERPIDVTSIHWEVSDDGEPSFATLVVPGPEVDIEAGADIELATGQEIDHARALLNRLAELDPSEADYLLAAELEHARADGAARLQRILGGR